jgi:hypothetical protein
MRTYFECSNRTVHDQDAEQNEPRTDSTAARWLLIEAAASVTRRKKDSRTTGDDGVIAALYLRCRAKCCVWSSG